MKTFKPAWLAKPAPAPEKPRERDTANRAFYWSPEWRDGLRPLKLATTPLCERCAKVGVTKVASIVHHIVPISEGGAALDIDNCESVCSSCHNRLHDEKGKWKR